MDFITYPKINSLWMRKGLNCDPGDKKGRKDFIEGEYSCTEFGLIRKWWVEEKIDGTNIRVHFDKENEKVRFGGRTENALIPSHLLEYLQDTFTYEKLAQFLDNSAVLFGEGYGPKIQKAGEFYSDTQGFVLFDVRIGQYWMMRDFVYVFSVDLGIPHAPFIDVMTEDEVVSYVKSKPPSAFAKKEMETEGVVCRTVPQLMNRMGQPLMFKLKCKDFR